MYFHRIGETSAQVYTGIHVRVSLVNGVLAGALGEVSPREENLVARQRAGESILVAMWLGS